MEPVTRTGSVRGFQVSDPQPRQTIGIPIWHLFGLSHISQAALSFRQAQAVPAGMASDSGKPLRLWPSDLSRGTRLLVPDEEKLAWLVPLSHSVPNDTVELHKPSEGLPVTANDDDDLGPGVCFYLGPLLRSYRRPGRLPTLGYLLKPSIEQPDWVGFPCDVGGVLAEGLDQDGFRACRLYERGWRAYLDQLVSRGFDGRWADYLDGRAPLPEVLPEPVRPYLRAGNAGMWTPEVRSPREVPLDSSSVDVSLFLLPIPSGESELQEQLAEAVALVTQSLQAQGVVIEIVPRFGAETNWEALHRASVARIRDLLGLARS
jgi:hypothetical protein